MNLIHIAHHHFLFTVKGCYAAPESVAELNRSHIPDADRGTLDCADHHILKIGDGVDKAEGADHEFLRTPLNDACAQVEVVSFDRLRHVVQSQIVLQQLSRIDSNLILTDVSALTGDVRDSRHRLDVPFDDPILKGSQFRHVMSI